MFHPDPMGKITFLIKPNDENMKRDRRRALTSWFDSSRDERLGLSDSFHGLFDFFIGRISFQTSTQI